MRRLGPARLARAGLLMAGGTAIGQMLLFLTSLVTVRLFTPEEMGIFATLSAVAACVVSFATGRYELAIPIPKSDREGLAIARIAMLLSGIFSTVFALILLAFGGYDRSGWLGSMINMFWAVPALTLSVALFQVGNQLAVRTENYGSISRRAILFPLVAGILQIVTGLAGLGSSGLILSVVLGQLTAFFALWIPVRKSIGAGAHEGLAQSARELAWKNRRFPLYLSASGGLNALSIQLPLLVVAGVYGLHAGGQYGVTMKIVALPVALVGQSVGYVFTGEIAKRQRERSGSVLRVFNAATLRLGVIGLVVLFAMLLLSRSLFPLILGDQWSEAGEFARLMSFGVFAQLVAAPLSQTLTIAGRQFTQFGLDLTRVALVGIVGVSATVMNYSASETVFGMSIAILLGYGLLWRANKAAAVEIDRRVRALKSGDSMNSAES